MLAFHVVVCLHYKVSLIVNIRIDEAYMLLQQCFEFAVLCGLIALCVKNHGVYDSEVPDIHHV